MQDERSASADGGRMAFERTVPVDLQIAGRAVLITGAAGGIGGAVAAELAAEGARVALVDRVAPAEGAARLRAAGAEAIALAADATSASAVAAAVAGVVSAFGGLDIVVGCAGISGPVGTGLVETEPAQWEQVFAVNVTGSFLLLRAALPVLERSGAPAVVFVASDSALVVAPGMAAYCASKAALLQLVRAASVEHPRVRINAVCPSIVDTPMSRGDLGIDGVDGFAGFDFPVQTAAEVAAEIAFLVSPRARAVDAAALVSDFGYSARSNFPA
ncbi:SDR family oxidoreductase [Microbacterium sp.]|uniref:SDR family oxidoreductase n=1 Tax=Microbacterium sp. TaxID=51671 RepID=UPI0039E63A58